MSLRIKKGSKVWGPKAPVARRPEAPPSAQSSTRPSVERQSQTPVPVSTHAEILPVLDEQQTLAEQPPNIEPQPAIAEPTTVEPSTVEPTTVDPAIIPQSHETASKEAPGAPSVAEVGGVKTLKRKESAQEEASISAPPKRMRVEVTSHHPPSTLQTSSGPVKLSPPNPVESGGLRPGLPVLESRQDIESSVYPDPELSSGLGPAGGLSSATARIPEGTGLGAAGLRDSNAAQIEQAPQIVPTTTSDIDPNRPNVAEETIAGPAKKKKKATRRRKVQPAGEGEDDARATLQMQLNAPRRIPGKRNRRKKQKGENKRGVTPDGAEDEQINPSTMKMAELCKDIRIGVKSSNHDMIQQRLIEQKVKVKLAKLNNEPVPPVEAAEEPESQNQEDPEDLNPSGPQMRIVNGQIVLAENSLRLDRHKRAEAENEEMVEVEENEFSRMTTSGTFMKREPSQVWDSVATATFYQGLAQFGTDFEMISKLFPTRSRRQIKLKFNNEERKNPAQLNKILTGKSVSIDLDDFEEMSGLKLEDVSEIERERLEIAEEQEQEVRAREKERTDADLRKKKEISDRSATAKRILGSMDDEPEEGGSGKENRNAAGGENMAGAGGDVGPGMASKGKGSKKNQPKPKKKKNPHGRSDGGEIVEVLGTVA
jgi:transcription factor TFIIIB component B''